MQVRCIAAVLIMIGHGHEHPDVVRRMLDVAEVPRKPQYSMAAEARPNHAAVEACGLTGSKMTVL